MRLLLDQGLPRSAAQLLRGAGLDVLHTGECGLAVASDAEILDWALRQGRTVVTLDADFHALLALSHAAGPSVVRIRIEGVQAEALAAMVFRVREECAEDLEKGALVSVSEDQIRVRLLPVLRRRRRG